MGNEASSETPSQQVPIPNDIQLDFKVLEPIAKAQKREGHSAIAYGKKLFIIGGGDKTDNGPVQEASFWCYDTESKEWTAMPSFAKIRTGSAFCTVDDKIYIFGGLHDTEGWLDDVNVFDIKTNAWLKDIAVTGNGPSPRDKHSCCAVGKKIYVFGGFGPKTDEDDDDDEEDENDMEEEEPATFGWFNDMHVFDTETLTWSTVSTSGHLPSPRAAFGGMCLVGSNIYIFGGRDNVQRTNDLFVFDTTSSVWSKPVVHGVQPASRSFHTTTVVGNKLVVFGGLSRANAHFNDVHIFDTVTSAWVQPKQVNGSIAARGFHSACLVDNCVYIFGGSAEYDASVQECKTYLTDLAALDVSSVANAVIEIPKPVAPATVPEASTEATTKAQ